MMRQQNINSTSQDRNDESFQNSEIVSSRRRLRGPLWKRIRGICMLLIFLGIVELGVASLTASHFNVTQVRLEGLDITPAASVEKFSHKLVGQNWIRANKHQVIQSIKKIPTVDDVTVRRVITWPPQLAVVVRERQPFALINGGGKWWKVDKKGVPYQTVKEPNLVNVDALTGPNFSPQLGKALPEVQWEKITRLLTTMRADQEKDANGFRWNLRRIYFDQSGNVSLRLKDTPHQELLLQIGNDQWSAKLSRARQALAYLDKTGQRAKVLNFVSYKIPTWVPLQKDTSSSSEADVHPSA